MNKIVTVIGSRPQFIKAAAMTRLELRAESTLLGAMVHRMTTVMLRGRLWNA